MTGDSTMSIAAMSGPYMIHAITPAAVGCARPKLNIASSIHARANNARMAAPMNSKADIPKMVKSASYGSMRKHYRNKGGV